MSDRSLSFGFLEEIDDDDEDDKDGAPRKFPGVVTGRVITNVDPWGLGRVQVQLAFIDSVDLSPWARVAVPMAGLLHGSYFIPIPGDQVLVAFEHGDPNVPYIIGCLWHGLAPPPGLSPIDPMTKRIIRTPLQLELQFDDLTRTITLTTKTQEIVLGPAGVEIKNLLPAPASVTVGADGSVSIKAANSIELTAREVKINAGTVEIKGGTVDVNAAGACDVKAGGLCVIKGAPVAIN
jgi:hypothetical protein